MAPELEIGDVLDIADMPPVSAKIHECIVEKIEVDDKNGQFFKDKNGTPYVKVHLVVDDRPEDTVAINGKDWGFNKRKLIDNYLPVDKDSTRWKDFILSSDAGTTIIKRTEEMLGKRVQVKVKHELYDDQIRGKVGGYIRRKA